MLGNLFAQLLSMSSLVYLLVWSPPPHVPYISSPNRILFATHADTIATCCCSIKIISSIHSLSSTVYLELLSFTLTLHIHLTILISACWSHLIFFPDRL